MNENRKKVDVFFRELDLSDTGDLELLAMMAGDDAKMNYDAGVGFFNSKMYCRAMELLRKADALGCAEAKQYIAEMYHQGLGVPQDKAMAFRINLEGATHGIIYSIYTLGVMYLHGIGTERDERKGLELMREAAERRYPQALNVMGCLYADGAVVEKDLSKAEAFFREAITLGDARAPRNLENLLSMEPDDRLVPAVLPKGVEVPDDRTGPPASR